MLFRGYSWPWNWFPWVSFYFYFCKEVSRLLQCTSCNTDSCLTRTNNIVNLEPYVSLSTFIQIWSTCWLLIKFRCVHCNHSTTRFTYSRHIFNLCPGWGFLLTMRDGILNFACDAKTYSTIQILQLALFQSFNDAQTLQLYHSPSTLTPTRERRCS